MGGQVGGQVGGDRWGGTGGVTDGETGGGTGGKENRRTGGSAWQGWHASQQTNLSSSVSPSSEPLQRVWWEGKGGREGGRVGGEGREGRRKGGRGREGGKEEGWDDQTA